jgi:hypothetical protein
MVEEKKDMGGNCGSNSTVNDETQKMLSCCTSTGNVEVTLPSCTLTVTAEHDRLYNDDDACDDSTGKQ